MATPRYRVGDTVHLKTDPKQQPWVIHRIKHPDGPYRIRRALAKEDSWTAGMNAYPTQLTHHTKDTP